MILGVILVFMTFLELYSDIQSIITNTNVAATIGVTLVAKTLILSGRNATNETKKLWNATTIQEYPSRFRLFYPIYVGVSLLIIISVEFLVNLPVQVDAIGKDFGFRILKYHFYRSGCIH